MRMLLRQTLWILTSLLLLRGALADEIRVLPPGQLPKDARLEPLKDQNGYFPFTLPKSKEEWAKRANEVRRQILLAAGLWPMPEKTPLNPVIHGKVDREGYTVERVYFESYPGHFVTGSLYRPKDRTGKLPVVLRRYGHWANGRFFDAGPDEIRKELVRGEERFEVSGRYILQALCVQLARMGCIVFQYDMVGVADSQQVPHTPEWQPKRDTLDRWGFASPQAEARLQTNFGLQTYNSIRALDFVCGLPDVDPARIGMTGGSGGGTQTFICCAIDPRPAVACPAVMVSTAMQGGCNCENAPYLRIGTGNVEFAAPVRPQAAHDDRRQRLDQGHAHQRLPGTQAALQTLGRGEQRRAAALPAIRPQLQLRLPGGHLLVVQQVFEIGPQGPDRRRRLQAAFDRRDDRLGRDASRRPAITPINKRSCTIWPRRRRGRSMRSCLKTKPRLRNIAASSAGRWK